ncbi:unnamed protein product [Gongylonema pulchrum]|uniref:Uncharacterized protein n=1 Tax=Gongylonema pulchrum TaxID=637853 RepID=A0A183D5V6_9BILA|nr:unnamed protein product [Gongylonema pulchrum]
MYECAVQLPQQALHLAAKSQLDLLNSVVPPNVALIPPNTSASSNAAAAVPVAAAAASKAVPAATAMSKMSFVMPKHGVTQPFTGVAAKPVLPFTVGTTAKQVQKQPQQVQLTSAMATPVRAPHALNTPTAATTAATPAWTLGVLSQAAETKTSSKAEIGATRFHSVVTTANKFSGKATKEDERLESGREIKGFGDEFKPPAGR